MTRASFECVRDLVPANGHRQRALRIRNAEAQCGHAAVRARLKDRGNRAPVGPNPASGKVVRPELQPAAPAQVHELLHLARSGKSRRKDGLPFGSARGQTLVLDLHGRFPDNAPLEADFPEIRRVRDPDHVADGRARGPNSPAALLSEAGERDPKLLHGGIVDAIAKADPRERLALAHGDLLQGLHRDPRLERVDADVERPIALQQAECESPGLKPPG